MEADLEALSSTAVTPRWHPGGLRARCAYHHGWIPETAVAVVERVGVCGGTPLTVERKRRASRGRVLLLVVPEFEDSMLRGRCGSGHGVSVVPRQFPPTPPLSALHSFYPADLSRDLSD